ncbi:MAG: serpin family protein [Dysgonamonadaceae bacterium]|nr:serpin family protein [Dysgonamonadaceae bacterium]
MKKNFIYLTAVSLLFSACDKNNNNGIAPLPDAKPIELRSELLPKIEQDNAFAFDLFKQVYQTEKTSNVFISPLSVSMALSMTLNGAKEQTFEEMKNALRISGFSMDEINEYCQTLKNALLKVDTSTEFSIANSIWYKQGFSVENNFLNVNKKYFGAEVTEADFSNPATLKRINQWCSDNTKGKIPTILDEIPADALMYLINAIYFKGIWKYQFDKKQTFDGTFYNESGVKHLIKMMNQIGNFEYFTDENARYLTLPYGNGAFSMRLLLPNENKTVEDVINHINPQSWQNISDYSAVIKVRLQLPRFKAECKYLLNEEALPKMGMVIPFSDNADFTGISKEGGIKISRVIHKTYVSVDEEGTEAAAVTAVEIVEMAMPPQTTINYIVDKPFVFVIQENSTGIILFAGVIKEL